jgi:hypothetical protein
MALMWVHTKGTHTQEGTHVASDLQELEYLNMAVNNVTRIQNLQRCESLQKLDLTINFVDKPGLLTISSLQVGLRLPCRELQAMGWAGWQQAWLSRWSWSTSMARHSGIT